ncbi:hypothetical protein AVEN_93596-1 [Araneus ventricosus]|uniref:Uncharacterized protein n=1 Tax=Araneus ventricosus TaxID=182803 RepID=A0A4Y2DM77_ARAVE|nr:hypothetical protein AVEN_93596-1 [Araneus ventricosus]
MRCTPSHKVFGPVHQTVDHSDRCLFQRTVISRERIVWSPDIEETVLHLLQENTCSSMRTKAQLVGISGCWWTLRESEMHPYRLQRVQGLEEGDYAPRVVFAQWCLQKHTQERSGIPSMCNSIYRVWRAFPTQNCYVIAMSSRCTLPLL